MNYNKILPLFLFWSFFQTTFKIVHTCSP